MVKTLSDTLLTLILLASPSFSLSMIATPSINDRVYIKIVDSSNNILLSSNNTHGLNCMAAVRIFCRVQELDSWLVKGVNAIGSTSPHTRLSDHHQIHRELDDSDFDLLFHGESINVLDHADKYCDLTSWVNGARRARILRDRSYEFPLMRDEGEGLSADNPLVFTFVYRRVFVSVSAVEEDGEISDEVLATGWYRNLRDVYYFLRSEPKLVSLPEVMKGVEPATVEQLHKEVLNDTDKFVTLLPESEYNKFRSRNGSSDRYNNFKLRSLVPDYDRNLATFHNKFQESGTFPLRLVLVFTNGADKLSDDIKVNNDKGRFLVDVVDVSGKHTIKHGFFDSVTEISRYLDESVFHGDVNFKLLLGSKILCNSVDYEMCIENADDELTLSEDKSEDKSAVNLLTLHRLGVKLNRNEEKHFITTVISLLHEKEDERFTYSGRAESKLDDFLGFMKYYERRYFGLNLAGKFRGEQDYDDNYPDRDADDSMLNILKEIRGTFMDIRINHDKLRLEFYIHETYYNINGFEERNERAIESVIFSYKTSDVGTILKMEVGTDSLYMGKFLTPIGVRRSAYCSWYSIRLSHVLARDGRTVESVVVDHDGFI